MRKQPKTSDDAAFCVRRITIDFARYKLRKAHCINITHAEYAPPELAHGGGWIGLSREGLAGMMALAAGSGAGAFLPHDARIAFSDALDLDPALGRDGRWRLPPDDVLILAPAGWIDFAAVDALNRAIRKRKAIPAHHDVLHRARDRVLRAAATRMEARR